MKISFSLIILWTILFTPLYGQSFDGSKPIRTSSIITVGKNLITGKDIEGTKLQFQNRIYKSQLDTTFQTLTLQLRGTQRNGKYYKNKGELAVLDLKSNEINWSKDINYANTTIEQYEGVLFWNKGRGSTTRIELTTGINLWNTNIKVFATIPNLNISLGYKFNSFLQELSKNLSCFELTTGNILWERTLDGSYGWDGMVNLNDTAIIIKSSGLHHINLKTGEGWDYEAKTRSKDYSKTIGLNAVGVALGALTGTFVITTGHDLVSNLVSNLTMDSLHIYYASRDYLTCLSHDGLIKWKTELPKETSHSTLLIDSTRVFLINEGEAEYNGKRYTYGKPYVAVFDKKTGVQQNLSIFDLDNNPLLYFITGTESIDLLFKDRSIRYSINDGSMITTTYDSTEIGELEYMVEMFGTCIKLDSTLQSLHSLDPFAVYLKSNNGNVVKLNKDMGFDKNIPLDDLYILRAETDKYSFLVHDNKILVLNDLKQEIAELNISLNFFILSNKIYALDNYSITEINL